MPSALFTTLVKTITIPLGADASEIMQGEFTTGDAESISFLTPLDAVPAGYGIEVYGQEQATEDDTPYLLVDSQGLPIRLGIPGTAVTIQAPCWPSWRIKADAAVATDVSFHVFKTHRM